MSDAHEAAQLQPTTTGAPVRRVGGEATEGTDRTEVRRRAGAGRSPGGQTVAEAYSFACMNCGHCWEQAYEIEHRTDTAGRPYVTYRADGVEVPSPLTRPTCDNCDGHHVRIMRSGQVSDAVASRWALEHHTERGVQRSRHWPTLHFMRRRPARPSQ